MDKKEDKLLPERKEDVIKYIVNSKRGCYLKENYIRKYFPDLYKEVNEYVDSNNIDYKIESKSNSIKEEFKIKFWYFINNINKTIVCEECGIKTTFNRNFKDGFRIRCSKHSQKSESSIKRKNTILNSDKYLDEFGNHVDNISKSIISKSKAEKTCMDRYKDIYGNPTNSSAKDPIVKEKMKNTCREVYGKEHYYQTNEFKEKSSETQYEKYGCLYVTTEEYHVRSKDTWLKKTIPTYLKYDITLLQTSNENYLYKFFCHVCKEEFEISIEMLSRRKKNDSKICLHCNPIDHNISLPEKSIFNLIKELLPNENILSNDRSLKIELDIYLPDKKFAIEFNGLYWHSDINKKDKNYHYNKTTICRDNGIFLLHIWEDDWNNEKSKEIIKSIIKNKLGIINDKIYARKCDIKFVNPAEKDIFLNNNHIQGLSRSTTNIGLYYQGELVSIMTFGRRKITNSNTELELLRFCNKLNCVVIGSASKLFSYFKKNFEFENLISFCDISQFSGKIYESLGFSYKHHTKNYWWVDPNKYVREHRYKFAKHKLVKSGFDPNLSENDIMISNGYYKIWGCGMDKYIYTKPVAQSTL